MTRHLQTGIKGEIIAVEYLKNNGYDVLAQNWRYKHKEIDIIAVKNNKLHFVEVKTRTGNRFGNPEESVSQAKMNHLKTAAEAYLYEHPQWLKIQFDVIAIVLQKGVVTDFLLIEDVFF